MAVCPRCAGTGIGRIGFYEDADKAGWHFESCTYPGCHYGQIQEDEGRERTHTLTLGTGFNPQVLREAAEAVASEYGRRSALEQGEATSADT